MIKKVIRSIVVVCIILEFVYVASTALFLNTSLFNRIVSLDPREISIRFAHGWSWVPGKVDLKNVQVRGQDRNVTWAVDLPRVETQIALTELFKKTVHFDKLIADSVKFKLTLKSEKEKEDWPVEPKSESNKIILLKKERWKLLFSKINIHNIEKLQVQDSMVKGNGKISGSFFLWPGIEAKVKNAALSIESGSVFILDHHLEDKRVIDHLKLDALVDLDQFHPYQVSGKEVLQYLNLTSSFSGDVQGVGLLNQCLYKTPHVRFTHGTGSLNGAVSIKQGRFAYPTHFKLDSQKIEIDAYQLNVSGSGAVEGSVSRLNGQGSFGALQVSLKQFMIAHAGSNARLFRGKHFRFRVETNDLDLRSPFENLWFNLKIPTSRFSNLNFLNFLLKGQTPGVEVQNGSGNIAVHLNAQLGSTVRKKSRPATGSIEINLNKSQTKLKNYIVQCQLKSRFNVKPIDLNSSVAEVSSADLSISDLNWYLMNGTHNESEPKAWWMNVNFHASTLVWHPKFEIFGHLNFYTKDNFPIIDYLKTKKKLSDVSTLFLKMREIKGSIDYGMDYSGWWLDSIEVRSNSKKVKGFLSKEGHFTQGALKLSSGVLSVGIFMYRDSTQVKLFPSDNWIFEKQKFLE